ncbi:PREDICTED: myotubularin-related protein 10-B [Ceratosolen solmsi marchali]|uniref:Myotubularin-related protein 10-B n=1 Tax=Ceratosolen solmsi marchali TaxID=326594 RepID=A0AAJ7DYK2_9HYME|nr:PREDICTED: myotubularin-related protein 10-B [Ceratosolen solmsi marchali]
MESKSCNNFISYVGFEEHEMQNLGSSRRNSINENSIKLLPGEAVVAKGQNVLMFEPVSESKQGISGVLSITNFKLTFVTADDNGDDIYQQNNLYGYTDTCLSNIDTIYLLMGDKKRKLVPGAVVPSKVKGIFIICKNLRTWSFSFKFSPIGDGKNVLNALLHHAFPTKHHLLFAYEYKEPYYSSVDKEVQLFRNITDWQNELDRTYSRGIHLKNGWRLSTANVEFQICPSLSEYIIVPASVTDSQLFKVAQHFQGSRPPVWSWSNEQGAALVKMSELCPSITERTQENIMLENIRKNHPRKIQPVIIELNKDISIKAVASSFSKFVHLCSPESVRQFLMQENNFYSLLESTKWLKYVSYCLQKAVEASEQLNNGVPVILQEGAGRDVCCIISSLVQLLSDPYFRTITGFQSLLQKEWVAAGHPFCDRLGHLKNDGSKKSPLFLLYLDCVWQLCQQFPAEFEFTETYLTTLWDTAHISIFETFIFNCERDRIKAATDPNTRLVLRSVWDWREQFNEQDILLFHNPLFNHPGSSSPSYAKGKSAFLKPLYKISCLEIWSQCYFRWIPHLVINNGGHNQIEMYARLLQNDVAQLQMDINGGGGISSSPIDKMSTYLLQMNINSFYPFSNKKSGNTVSTPIINTSFIMSESMIDAESLLTAPD